MVVVFLLGLVFVLGSWLVNRQLVLAEWREAALKADQQVQALADQTLERAGIVAMKEPEKPVSSPPQEGSGPPKAPDLRLEAAKTAGRTDLEEAPKGVGRVGPADIIEMIHANLNRSEARRRSKYEHWRNLPTTEEDPNKQFVQQVLDRNASLSQEISRLTAEVDKLQQEQAKVERANANLAEVQQNINVLATKFATKEREFNQLEKEAQILLALNEQAVRQRDRIQESTKPATKPKPRKPRKKSC